MTTTAAQRRLLEAMADLERLVEDGMTGLGGLIVGLPIAIDMAERAGLPALAQVYVRIGELAMAVQQDMAAGGGGSRGIGDQEC